MSTVTRPRGPLPARVYWTRRLVVLLLAFALVFGIARLLGGGLGGDPEPQSARPVGSTASGSPDAGPANSQSPAATTTPRADDGDDEATPRKKRKKEPLPQPDGPCDDADVRITPRIANAHAGSPVPIVLELTTREAEACTWEVSPDTVVLKLTSGIDPIWSSQECPAAIPTEEVVPRRKQADTVTVMWNSKRSDPGCSAATDWALPGWYHAEAVARGSVRPVDKQFELKGPVRRTITPTPTPTPEPEKKKPAERRVGTPTEGRR